jgi:2-dehydro-3-deoxygluconokinase
MKVVTLGEIMLRLAPPGFQRFTQARAFEAVYGGGEANVAVSLAHYGEPVEFVTRLPKNDLGEACLMALRAQGVGTNHIARGGERIGIYFLESGVAQRPSKVIYDRAGSSFATIERNMLQWDEALKDVDWFHWTGITPAVSSGAATVCEDGIRATRSRGATVSCDLNYRSKLWKWTDSPAKVMEKLLALSDVAIGNEEDAEKVFGIRPAGSDASRGQINPPALRRRLPGA